MEKVLFIGSGEIGTALVHVIGERAHLERWDRDPKRAPGMRSLEESVPDASMIFLCVPSWVVRELLVRIAPLMRPDTIVVSLAKGIEEKSLKTMDVVLRESLPNKQPFGILGGPLLAEELMADLPGVGVFASDFREAFERATSLFEHSRVRLEYADDPHGVALTAVLKNVYAMGLGIADGLGWGWNGKGWFAARAIREMSEILVLLGSPSTRILGSAGIGDFLATAMSPDSQNRQTGREIAQSGARKISGEGCHSLPSILALLKNEGDRFSLLLSLDRIIQKQEDPKIVFQDLFIAP